MPAAPEVGDGVGHVGIVEVFLVVEAAHQAHADGHIGVGGEVQIDLQHEGQHHQPHAGDGGVLHDGRGELVVELDGEGLLHDLGAAVGQHGLFGQAHGKAGDAPADLGELDLPVEDVLIHVPVADDGARHALMEQAGIEQQQPVFPLDLRVAPIDVHHVGQQLEGVEADADGQHDVGDHLGEAQQELHVPQEEARVLEDAQDHQAERHAGHQPMLGVLLLPLGPVDEQGEEPADEGHAQQQGYVTDARPGVEHQGKAEHNDIFCFDAWHQSLGDDVRHKEHKDKNQTGKDQENRLLSHITIYSDHNMGIIPHFVEICNCWLCEIGNRHQAIGTRQ